MSESHNKPPTPVRAVPEATTARKDSRQARAGVRPRPISRDAQRLATAILEVLAGVRTPTDAAAALGMIVQRYYVWEQRALEALVAACEPPPTGQAFSPRHQIAALQKEVARLKQECARQQALVRAAQRTIGLSPPVPKPLPKPGEKAGNKAAGKPGGKKPRPRPPAVRALKVAAALRAMPVVEESAAPSSPGMAATDVLQRSAEDRLPPAAVPAEAGLAAAGT